MKQRIGLALLVLPLLASCGLKGDLATPPPMWGEARERYDAAEAQRKAEAEAAGEETKAAKTVPTPPPPSRPVQASPIQAPGFED